MNSDRPGAPTRGEPRSAVQMWTLAAFVVWSGVVVFSVAWIVSALRSGPPVAAPSPIPIAAPAAPPLVRVPFGGRFDERDDDDDRDEDERKKEEEWQKELDKRLDKAEKERRKWESKGGKRKGDD